MQKFVQMSINHQNSASTAKDAVKAFEQSCNICSSRGIKLDCDRCPIKSYHDITVSALLDSEDYDRQKSQTTLIS